MNDFLILNSLMNNVFAEHVNPAVDVLENEKSYSLQMELPGRNEKDVSIELNRDNLIIYSKDEEQKSEKKIESAAIEEKTKYLLQERRKSSFRRTFSLPSDVDSSSISAIFKNGILTVNMKKTENSSPKKIEILAS